MDLAGQFAKHHHQLYKRIPLGIGLVMGYHTDHVPAFDQLAQQFCVYDRWFSSLLGAYIPPIPLLCHGGYIGWIRHERRDNPAPVDMKTVFDYMPKHALAVLLSRCSVDMAVQAAPASHSGKAET